MSYKERSRKENKTAYNVAGFINLMFVFIGLMAAMVGVSAIEGEAFGPAVIMILGILMIYVGLSNIIIMEGGEIEDEEVRDYQS